MTQPLQVASLFGRLSLQDDFSSALSRALGDSQTQARNMFSNIGSNITNVGTQITAATAGITATVVAGVAAFVKWEDAFADVLKTVDFDTSLANGGITADSFEASLRTLATSADVATSSLGNAHMVVANVAALGGQLGITNQNLLGFTETMTLMGVATNLSAEAAATAAAQYANITGLPQDEFDNFASAIVHLGNNSATTERDIMNMSLRISAAGSLAGLTDAEIIGLSTAMASMGIRAEAGGSAMTRILNEMSAASASFTSGFIDNSGRINDASSENNDLMIERARIAARATRAQEKLNDTTDMSAGQIEQAAADLDHYNNQLAKIDAEAAQLGVDMEAWASANGQAYAAGNVALQTFARTSGMTAEEFSTMWGDNAPQALENFLTGLSGMNVAEQTQVLEDLGLSGIRVSDVLRRLAEGTLDITDIMDMATGAYEDNTALQEEAARKAATLGGSFRRLKNNVFDLAVEFGDKLAPTVAKITDFIINSIAAIRDWVAKHEILFRAIAPVLLALTVLGPVVMAIGGAFSAVGAIVTAFTASLGLILSPIGLVVGAVAAFGVAVHNNLFGLGDAFERIARVGEVWLTRMERIFSNEGISGVLEELPRMFSIIGSTIAEEAGKVWDNVQAFDWQGFADKMGEKMMDFNTWLNDNVGQPIKDWWNNVDWSATATSGASMLRKLQDGIDTVMLGIGKWIDTYVLVPIINYFTGGNYSSMEEAGPVMVDALKSGIETALNGLWTWISVNWLAPWALWFANEFYRIGKDGRRIADGIKESLAAAWADITTWFDTNIVQPFENAIFNWTSQGKTLMVQGRMLMQGLLDGIVSLWVDITGWLDTNIVQPFILAIKNLFGIASPSTVMVAIGANIVQGLIDGIGGLGETLYQTALSAGTRILNGIASNFIDMFTWVQENIVTPFTTAFSEENLATVIEAGISIAVSLANGILEWFSLINTWVFENVISVIASAIFGTDWTSTLFAGRRIAIKVGMGIIHWFRDIVNWVKIEIIDKIVAAITASLGAVLQAGKDIGQAILDGIKEMLSGIGDWIKNQIEEAMGGLSNLTLIGGWQPFANLGGAPPNAAGGPVSAGSPVTVGDGGQEMFVPGVDGYVMAQRRMEDMIDRSQSSGGGTTYQINVTVDPTLLADANLEENASIFAQHLQAAMEGTG